jgi:hypothetical protein
MFLNFNKIKKNFVKKDDIFFNLIKNINDYEIKSLTPIQTIPIKAYLQTYRPKLTPNTNTLTYISILNMFLNIYTHSIN